MPSKHLSVRLQGQPIADLEQLETGRLRLTYLPESPRSLSLSLPVREEPYEDAACEAFFGGLLPESQAARNRLAQKYRISPRSTFALLKAIGVDCAGAVSLHDPDETVEGIDAFQLQAEPISEAELAAHIERLPRNPLFMDVEGMRLSLAGAQDKAAVCLVDNQPALPLHGTPTTHILKPPIPNLEGTVLNEYLCLTFARAVGFQVPKVEIREAEGRPYLLIERYDRVMTEEGTIKRIHQEDFCQALGVLSENKYQANGGPGVQESFELVRQMERPAVASLTLLRQMAFNVLVGNCDAHAKNYSILHPDGKKPGLAPVYDVLSMIYYPDLNRKLAMKIGGEYAIERLFARHWQRFASDGGVKFKLMRQTLGEIGSKLLDAIAQERREASNRVAIAILDVVEGNASTLLQRCESSVDQLADTIDRQTH